MLAADARLRRSQDFTRTLRTGRRYGRATLVLTLLRAGPRGPSAAPAAHGSAVTDPPSPRVGFVVGGRIGGAVVRNRLRRRLQHLVADRLPRLPAGSCTVIRALPGAERLAYPELAGELDRLLSRAIR